MSNIVTKGVSSDSLDSIRSSAGEIPTHSTASKKNNKKSDFLKRRVRSRMGKKARTIDDFLTGEKRRNLAKEIQERAHKYKLVSMHVYFS
jgi:hypothetical protein